MGSWKEEMTYELAKKLIDSHSKVMRKFGYLNELNDPNIKQMEITEGSIICRKINLVFNKLDDEVVMLSMENNEYYGLNIIGSRYGN